MKVTPHKLLVHRGVEYGLRSLSDIALLDAKQLLVSCRKQLGKKDPEFDSKVLHSFKTPKWILKKIIVVLNSTKMFLFEKIDNNFQFNSLFLWSSQIFFCPRKAGGFFMWELKKTSFWSSVLFTVLPLEMRKREAYRKQTRSKVSVLLNKVSVLEHDRFMQVSHAVSWIFANSVVD